jgi:prepilin signal peptidase PulO-like enzyme (type II secretory pathway)
MSLRIVVFLLFSLVISIIDSKTLKIPDLLLLSCFFFLVIMDVYASKQAIFFLENFLAAFIWFIIFYLIFLFKGGIGFGDVKYAFLMGYALGLDITPFAFLCTAVCAILVYAIGIGILGWKLSDRLPFAPFMCSGALSAVSLNLTASKWLF